MYTTSVQPAVQKYPSFRQREQVRFSTIPGMAELARAENESQMVELRLMYPDADFAQMILSNLFCPNRELNSIYLRAYQAILEGEVIEAIRFRFHQEIETYWANHMWDD